MLFLYTGTDTQMLRTKLNAAVEKAGKGKDIVRITDAHALHDLETSMMGGGMFGGTRVIVFDGVLANSEMRDVVLNRLVSLKTAADDFYVYEPLLDAATRKQIEKFAEATEKADAAKTAKQETIFNLVRHVQAGKKKDLWVAYQREIAAGKAPEAIHGMLFYAAKDSLLRNPKDERAKRLVIALTELPHESRRNGYELEYALEHFVLSGV
jgi:hypothetical protein